MWFDIIFSRDHSSACGKMQSAPAQIPSGSRAVAEFVPTRLFEIESTTLENWIPGDYWNSPTYRELQSNSYSNVFFFLLNSGWAASGWTSGGNLCSLSDWKTAASSKAVDTQRCDTPYLADCEPCGTVPLSSAAGEQAFPLARWKGCKLHFMAANPVANGTLSRVHVVAGVLLAGAGFVLLLPPSTFFPSYGPFLDSRVTECCKGV